MPDMTIEKFIAHFREREPKEQSLEQHLMGVSALTAKFAAKVGLSECGELIGLLHDIGKYSAEFQAYLRSAVGQLNQDEDEEWVDAKALKGKVDHSTAGAQFIWEALNASADPIAIRVAQVLSICIASHHSGLIDCLGTDGSDVFGKRVLKSRERTHIDEVRRSMDVTVRSHGDALLRSESMVGSLKDLVGRILIKNGQLPIAQQHQLGLAVRFLFSCLIDADRIDTANFERERVKRNRPIGSYIAWATLVDRLESHLSAFTPAKPIDSIRRDISNHCLKAAKRPKGTYTLTVPTGGGKTLASLRFALHHANEHRMERVIYIIPFTSIIDQNSRVVRSILDPDAGADGLSKIVLEHHSSITPEQQTWREKMLCESWDAPIVYTTMVQFLESLFGAGTRGARRMHQLANAVIVFDEIQSLPIKCVHLFNNAANFLVEQCGSTVVLCSATQPLLDKVSKQHGALRMSLQQEIMPDVTALFDHLRRVEVVDKRKPGGWQHTEVAELVLSEEARAGNCLVIVNTKDTARCIFHAVGSCAEQDARIHLSTDMCPAHRKQMLARVKNRLAEGKPVICVSTQLIEAGVDIDFRVVIRCLAGVDSIAQAAGRCNRNGSPEPGTVHIVNLADEKLNSLPDIAVGKERSQQVLDDFRADPSRYRNNLFGPEALADYYKYYFFDRQSDMKYPVSAKEIGHDGTLLELLSSNDGAKHAAKELNIADRLLYQSFMTAAKVFKSIDAPTRAVVVPHGSAGKDLIARLHAAYDVELEFDLLREAQQYSVNVFPHILEKLKGAGAVTEAKPDTRILTLDPRYYSPVFGLSTEPVVAMEPLHA